MEKAFFCFEEQLMLTELMEDLRNVMAMFGQAPGIY
jgi:hypothetical protein